MKNEEKGFSKNQPEDNSLIEEMNRRIEIANGDPMEYITRFNRHTLNVSLTDEQANKQRWEGVEITFYNEDNAINHLSFVGASSKFSQKKKTECGELEWQTKH